MDSESIESFVSSMTGRNGEPVQSDTKRRARMALTSFHELLVERGKLYPDETDYEAFMQREPDNSTTKQKMSYIRRYFELEERRNTTMLQNENTTILNTEKKKQVSVYLSNDTYQTLKVLAQVKATTIGEILSNCATRIAKKNVDNGVYSRATEALKTLSSIVLDYSE